MCLATAYCLWCSSPSLPSGSLSSQCVLLITMQYYSNVDTSGITPILYHTTSDRFSIYYFTPQPTASDHSPHHITLPNHTTPPSHHTITPPPRHRGLVGTVLTMVSVLWCSISASKLFVSALSMDHQQLLVAYPCALVYGIFALLTVF